MLKKKSNIAIGMCVCDTNHVQTHLTHTIETKLKTFTLKLGMTCVLTVKVVVECVQRNKLEARRTTHRTHQPVQLFE